MANPMLSVQFRSVVEPILNEVFDSLYDLHKPEWSQVFREQKGIARAYHEEPVAYGFGLAQEVPEGEPVPRDDGGILFIQRYYYKVFGLSFAMTKVLIEDGDHISLGKMFSEHLSRSMIETKETLCANILNRSFSGSYVGGDGVSLINTAHPIINGTFSNQLATAAALSQTSLEQLLTQIMQAVDQNGKKINLRGRKLVVPPALALQAEVLLKSLLRAGTANNDINPVVSMGLVPDGSAIMTRLTSSTAWWVSTDAPDGLKLMMRRGLERSMEGDFETDSMRYKATERYIPNWTDPRGLYGTAGL